MLYFIATNKYYTRRILFKQQEFLGYRVSIPHVISIEYFLSSNESFLASTQDTHQMMLPMQRSLVL
jgi:hypothetical protein